MENQNQNNTTKPPGDDLRPSSSGVNQLENALVLSFNQDVEAFEGINPDSTQLRAESEKCKKLEGQPVVKMPSDAYLRELNKPRQWPLKFTTEYSGWDKYSAKRKMAVVERGLGLIRVAQPVIVEPTKGTPTTGVIICGTILNAIEKACFLWPIAKEYRTTILDDDEMVLYLCHKFIDQTRSLPAQKRTYSIAIILPKVLEMLFTAINKYDWLKIEKCMVASALIDSMISNMIMCNLVTGPALVSAARYLTSYAQMKGPHAFLRLLHSDTCWNSVMKAVSNTQVQKQLQPQPPVIAETPAKPAEELINDVLDMAKKVATSTETVSALLKNTDPATTITEDDFSYQENIANLYVRNTRSKLIEPEDEEDLMILHDGTELPANVLETDGARQPTSDNPQVIKVSGGQAKAGTEVDVGIEEISDVDSVSWFDVNEIASGASGDESDGSSSSIDDEQVPPVESENENDDVQESEGDDEQTTTEQAAPPVNDEVVNNEHSRKLKNAKKHAKARSRKKQKRVAFELNTATQFAKTELRKSNKKKRREDAQYAAAQRKLLNLARDQLRALKLIPYKLSADRRTYVHDEEAMLKAFTPEVKDAAITIMEYNDSQRQHPLFDINLETMRHEIQSSVIYNPSVFGIVLPKDWQPGFAPPQTIWRRNTSTGLAKNVHNKHKRNLQPSDLSKFHQRIWKQFKAFYQIKEIPPNWTGLQASEELVSFRNWAIGNKNLANTEAAKNLEERFKTNRPSTPVKMTAEDVANVQAFDERTAMAYLRGVPDESIPYDHIGTAERVPSQAVSKPARGLHSQIKSEVGPQTVITVPGQVKPPASPPMMVRRERNNRANAEKQGHRIPDGSDDEWDEYHIGERSVVGQAVVDVVPSIYLSSQDMAAASNILTQAHRFIQEHPHNMMRTRESMILDSVLHGPVDDDHVRERRYRGRWHRFVPRKHVIQPFQIKFGGRRDHTAMSKLNIEAYYKSGTTNLDCRSLGNDIAVMLEVDKRLGERLAPLMTSNTMRSDFKGVFTIAFMQMFMANDFEVLDEPYELADLTPNLVEIFDYKPSNLNSIDQVHDKFAALIGSGRLAIDGRLLSETDLVALQLLCNGLSCMRARPNSRWQHTASIFQCEKMQFTVLNNGPREIPAIRPVSSAAIHSLIKKMAAMWKIPGCELRGFKRAATLINGQVRRNLGKDNNCRFVTASLEMQSVTLPGIYSHNILWTMMDWDAHDTHNAPWRFDAAALYNGSIAMNNIAGALCAFQISVSISTFMHKFSITGNVLNAVRAAHIGARNLPGFLHDLVTRAGQAEVPWWTFMRTTLIQIFGVHISAETFADEDFCESLAFLGDRPDPNDFYAGIWGETVPYLVEPYCTAILLENWPDAWSTIAPPVKMNVKNECQFIHGGMGRGVFTHLGDGGFKEQAEQASFWFFNRPYGIQVLNAMKQEFEVLREIPVYLMQFVRKGDKVEQEQRVGPLIFECDPVFGTVLVGQFVTYNWLMNRWYGVIIPFDDFPQSVPDRLRNGEVICRHAGINRPQAEYGAEIQGSIQQMPWPNAPPAPRVGTGLPPDGDARPTIPVNVQGKQEDKGIETNDPNIGQQSSEKPGN